MKSIARGCGVYRDSDGAYWIRPLVNGLRTTRKLNARNEADALAEKAQLDMAVTLAEASGGRNPFSPRSETVAKLIALYEAHGCDSGRCRVPESVRREAEYLGRIRSWWGNVEADVVRPHHCYEYRDWRSKQVQFGSGNRIVDLELQALSNVLNFGVSRGLVIVNHLKQRPRFDRLEHRRNCREVMPESGDVLNDIAAELFKMDAAAAWQMLFEAMTGVRTCEALRLRWNAKRGEAGFIEGDRLDVQRAKKGIRPWVVITPELRELLDAHKDWHGGRFEAWFPCRDGRLSELLAALHGRGFPKVTSHGMRAYFVTKMRRDGHLDSDVAAMSGDKTVALIQNTYGMPRPGEEPLSFKRRDGTCAWAGPKSHGNVLAFPLSVDCTRARAVLAAASPTLS